MKTDKLFYSIFLSESSLIHELIPSIFPDSEYTAELLICQLTHRYGSLPDNLVMKVRSNSIPELES
jgi:hypothetical protein